MDVDEVLAGRRAPVSDHQRLDVRERQRFAQKRVIVKIYLPHGQIVGGPPIRIRPAQFFRTESSLSRPGRNRARRVFFQSVIMRRGAYSFINHLNSYHALTTNVIAAIDIDSLSGNGARLVRNQKGRRFADLFQRNQLMQRRLRRRLFH